MTNEIIARWSGFLKKVSSRFDEIMEEADGGFDQIIAMDVVDAASMSGALTAFRSRIIALTKKVTDAQTKLTFQAPSNMLDELNAQGENLIFDIETRMNEIMIVKRAKAAAELWLIAESEMNLPRKCNNCSGILTVPIQHAASSPTCPFCATVNQVQPSAAVTAYYYGDGIAAQCEKEALEKWHIMNAEEFRYENIRTPCEKDKQQYLSATEDFWTSYYTNYANLHPSWTMEQVPKEVKGKMGHVTL